MIRLVVKLVVAALVANAVYRVGSEYLTFYRFRDSVRSAATYRARTDEELRARIVTLVAEYDIPLGGRDVAIVRDDQLITVNAWYHKAIEVLPRYPVQWRFDISLQVPVASVPPLPGAPARP